MRTQARSQVAGGALLSRRFECEVSLHKNVSWKYQKLQRRKTYLTKLVVGSGYGAVVGVIGNQRSVVRVQTISDFHVLSWKIAKKVPVILIRKQS